MKENRMQKHLEGQLFTITPVGGSQEPFVATITPLNETPPPTPPDDPTLKWVFGADGWYLAWGPCQKPQPLPPGTPEGIDGNWSYNGEAWYWAMGPFDKPRPPG